MNRIFKWIESALLRHGTQPKTIFFLAVLSVLDSFLPVLPAELFVLALCILQPQKGKTIVVVFAVSSALSAFLLALALGTLSSSADAWSQQLLDTQGPETMAIVRDWGPVSMVFFSIFPDTPRASIALLSLSGVTPFLIAGMVCIGKLMLYAGLLLLIHHLPSRVGRWRGAASFWQKFLQRRASRFVAYCRRIRWLAQSAK
jgi:membrane protein YqaA with SNARE-associated domain